MFFLYFRKIEISETWFIKWAIFHIPQVFSFSIQWRFFRICIRKWGIKLKWKIFDISKSGKADDLNFWLKGIFRTVGCEKFDLTSLLKARKISFFHIILSKNWNFLTNLDGRFAFQRSDFLKMKLKFWESRIPNRISKFVKFLPHLTHSGEPQIEEN